MKHTLLILFVFVDVFFLYVYFIFFHHCHCGRIRAVTNISAGEKQMRKRHALAWGSVNTRCQWSAELLNWQSCLWPILEEHSHFDQKQLSVQFWQTEIARRLFSRGVFSAEIACRLFSSGEFSASRACTYLARLFLAAMKENSHCTSEQVLSETCANLWIWPL